MFSEFPTKRLSISGICRDRNSALLLERDVLTIVINSTLYFLLGNERRLAIIVDILIGSHRFCETAEIWKISLVTGEFPGEIQSYLVTRSLDGSLISLYGWAIVASKFAPFQGLPGVTKSSLIKPTPRTLTTRSLSRAIAARHLL